MSTWRDAKTSIAEAPLDTRRTPGILAWYALLAAVVRGPELSADLPLWELDMSSGSSGSVSLGEDFRAYIETLSPNLVGSSRSRAGTSRLQP